MRNEQTAYPLHTCPCPMSGPMSGESILDNLSPEQHAAATATEPAVMVVAGAGSGKTRTLIARIVHLLRLGVDPAQIVGFTFTRHAAREMRERLTSEFGEGRTPPVWLGTMHSWALQQVRRHGRALGYRHPEQVQILGPAEELALLRQIGDQLGLYDLAKGQWKGNLSDAVVSSTIYPTMDPRDGEPMVSVPTAQKDVHRIRQAMSRATGVFHLTTYTLVMWQLWQLCRELEVSLPAHLLVDEVQDLDGLQWEVVRLLHDFDRAHGHLADVFLVGDVDQSLYEWRGATPRMMLAWQQHCAVYYLRTNYRSQDVIVRAANNVIRHNQVRDANMRMEPQGADSGGIQVREWAAIRYYLFEAVDHSIKTIDVSLAVIARTHWQLERLAAELTAANIPFTYLGRGKTRVLESPEAALVHAWLRVLANPLDDFSFGLCRGAAYLHEDYHVIRARAVDAGRSMAQQLAHDHPGMLPPTPGSLRAALPEVLVMIDAFGTNDQYKPIYDYIAAWVLEYPRATIADYLEHVALRDAQGDLDAGGERPRLQLMTVHAAKGLEFDHVIILCCNEGSFPGKRSIAANEIEQERRCFYVAMTRARWLLTMAHDIDKDPSRFMGEAEEAI